MNKLSAFALVLIIGFLPSMAFAQRSNSDRPPAKRSDEAGKRGGKRGPRGKARGGDRDMAKFLFGRFDDDNDGVIQLDQVPDKAKERLSKMDTNQDGKLERSEVQAAAEKFKGRRGGDRDQPGARPGPPGRRGPKGGAGEGRFAEMFSKLDKNGDQKISADEAPERLKGRFDKLDQNGDNSIDAEEWKVLADRIGDRKKGGRMKGDRGKRKGSPDESTRPQRPKRPGSGGRGD